MQYAIATLQITLSHIEESERMHRAEEEIAAADRELSRSDELRQAIAILRAASNGPIWSEPK